MLKNKLRTVKLGLVAGIISLVIVIISIAITPVNTLAQITSVSQLADVQPTDYYFQELQSLIERYGCVTGFPDGIFSGYKQMTRFEVIEIMNSCIDKAIELIIPSSSDKITKAEVTSLKNLINKLQQEVELIQRSRSSSQPRI